MAASASVSLSTDRIVFLDKVCYSMVLFFVPLISFIGYQSRTADAEGFFKFWWMQMHSLLDWHLIVFAAQKVAIEHANDFSLWHLWFISLLLIFLS